MAKTARSLCLVVVGFCAFLTPTVHQWGSAQSSVPSVTIRVEADGTGDYRTLEEALQEAPPGAAVVLGPGVYQLDRGAEITRPLSLQGAGMHSTIIESPGPGYVLKVNVTGRIEVRGITFKYTGDDPGDAVLVEAAELFVSECGFRGAHGPEESKQAGLRLAGTTQGTVERCLLTENPGGAGMTIGGSSRVTILSSTFSACVWGIAFVESALGIARGNTCERNESCGIYVTREANPTLERNMCRFNESSGLAYLDNAGGRARNNTCFGNRYGIYVASTARPTLGANMCSGNSAADVRDDR